MTSISEGQDIIDSRDVIARIAELESDAESSRECDHTDARRGEDGTCPVCFNEDDHAELLTLLTLQEEAEGCPDWLHGEALIADHYFETYARELAEDIGAIGRDLAWPACHIDWEAAADALRMDYTSVTFGETEYWIRG